MSRKRKAVELGDADVGQAVIAKICELSKNSTAHTPDQSHDTAHLCVVLTDHLVSEMTKAIVLASDSPIMQYYSCDSTPLHTKKGCLQDQREDNQKRGEPNSGLPFASGLLAV